MININRIVSDIHKIINSYFSNYDYLQADIENKNINKHNPVIDKQKNTYFKYINVNGKIKKLTVIKKKNKKRNRKISCKLLANIILKKNYTGNTYENILTSFDIENYIKISKSAVIQKRTSNSDILTKLNDKLISYIYHDNKPRIIAVDGSQINLPKELHKNGFKLSENKGYSVGHISGLYDIFDII